MKISDISAQQKNTSRYSVFVDGKYSFSLSDWQLVNSGIKIEQEVDAQLIKQYKQESNFGKIYDRTLMWLGLRPRSLWEINEYLRKKTDDQEIIEQITDKLDAIGQINDLKFAQSWVNSRRSFKLTSKYRLVQELRQKRVPQEVINQVLADDEVTDQETIRQIITKKSKQSKYKDQDKLIAYLARQGFKYDDIKSALMQETDN